MKSRFLLFFLLVGCLLIMVTPVVAADAYDYIVQPGDTLFSVARRYGVDVRTLAVTNNLTVNSWLYVGQRLVIPGVSSTLSPAPTSPTTANVYVVQPGDTLISIAMRHGVSVGELASANGLVWNSWVYSGQRLMIPGGASSPAPSQPSAAPSNGIHIVQAGENLFRIGLKYGTTANAIRVANGLAYNIIYVGQRLKIPGLGLTPISPSPESPAPPPTNPGTGGEKWIDVNLSTQTITAYQGQTAVYSALVSTGLRGTPTVVGTYRINTKYLSAPMSGPGYYLPNVPHIMYFYAGYAIHGAYWHNNFGTPMSHGCVNLSLPDAEWFYNWAPKGTKVVTHY